MEDTSGIYEERDRFDCRNDIKCGWLDKHFRDGKIPDKAIYKSEVPDGR